VGKASDQVITTDTFCVYFFRHAPTLLGKR
jgi:hypothetical protein